MSLTFKALEVTLSWFFLVHFILVVVLFLLHLLPHSFVLLLRRWTLALVAQLSLVVHYFLVTQLYNVFATVFIMHSIFSTVKFGIFGCALRVCLLCFLVSFLDLALEMLMVAYFLMEIFVLAA